MTIKKEDRDRVKKYVGELNEEERGFWLECFGLSADVNASLSKLREELDEVKKILAGKNQDPVPADKKGLMSFFD